MHRRTVLQSGLLLGTGTLLAGGRLAFSADPASGYGPLAPVRDAETGLPLLRLPQGFSYRSLSWAGDAMADGMPTPDRHDGMAVVRTLAAGGDSFVLMRNHERVFASRLGGAVTPVYDRYAAPPRIPGCGGGTTALVFENGRLSKTVPTMSGTVFNCAGGATPWGSWLTCEEMIVTGRENGAMHHGYVFEVPSPDLGAASARPIVAMGRMKHEAVGFDGATGFAYLTEDNGPSGPSGFYRFRPDSSERRVGAFERGGRLEMLKVRERPNADLGRPKQGDSYDVEWVPIDDPDADAEEQRAISDDAAFTVGFGRSGPFMQGQTQGGASFMRLEGCFAHDGLIYFTDTIGGAAGTGVLWALEPAPRDGADVLRCVYVSAGEGEADHIDNLCVGPRGGIVLCEDGGGVESDGGLAGGNHVVGLGRDGVAFRFAENNVVIESPLEGRPSIEPGDYRGMEFAGVCFSPRGDCLFVNLQTPGITFEIRGPWERGPL